MANDPNKDEMMNKEVKTEGASGENGGEPKKKKITAVFRTQNSRQNSLKSRPSQPQQPAKKKPASCKTRASRREAGGITESRESGGKACGSEACRGKDRDGREEGGASRSPFRRYGEGSRGGSPDYP